MSVEILEDNFDTPMVNEHIWATLNDPINGSDARRRLESKLEEMRLRKELKEFDFDLN